MMVIVVVVVIRPHDPATNDDRIDEEEQKQEHSDKEIDQIWGEFNLSRQEAAKFKSIQQKVFDRGRRPRGTASSSDKHQKRKYEEYEEIGGDDNEESSKDDLLIQQRELENEKIRAKLVKLEADVWERYNNQTCHCSGGEKCLTRLNNYLGGERYDTKPIMSRLIAIRKQTFFFNKIQMHEFIMEKIRATITGMQSLQLSKTGATRQAFVHKFTFPFSECDDLLDVEKSFEICRFAFCDVYGVSHKLLDTCSSQLKQGFKLDYYKCNLFLICCLVCLFH